MQQIYYGFVHLTKKGTCTILTRDWVGSKEFGQSFDFAQVGLKRFAFVLIFGGVPPRIHKPPNRQHRAEHASRSHQGLKDWCVLFLSPFKCIACVGSRLVNLVWAKLSWSATQSGGQRFASFLRKAKEAKDVKNFQKYERSVGVLLPANHSKCRCGKVSCCCFDHTIVIGTF